MVATGDVHMSNRLPYARPSTLYRTDRLDRQLAMLAALGQYGLDNGIDRLLINGDLFDKALLDPVTVSETFAALARLPIHIWIIGGNHDAINIRGGRYNIEALGEFENITVFHAGEHIDVDNITFWAMPYASLESNRETLKAIRADMAAMGSRRHHVLLMHNSVLGCKQGDWKCDVGLDPSELSGFDQVISGHFHTAQKFGDNGIYLGAPMQHHYGDCGDRRGAWHLKFKADRTMKRKFIDTAMPKFHMPSDTSVPKDAAPGDYIRWVVNATHADWIKLKPDVEASRQAAVDAGYIVEVLHRPIYQHSERMTSETGDVVKITMEKMVGRYLNNATVSTGALDTDKLKQLGLDILAEARTR